MKELLIFLSGIGIGGVVAWYITKEIYEEKINEEVDLVQSANHRIVKSEMEKRKEAEQELENERARQAAAEDYIPEDIEKELAERESPREEGYTEESYFIDQDTFEATTPYYDKMMATYYQANECLVLEELEDEWAEKEIPELEDIIGHDILEKLRTDEMDRTMVYVRNDAHGVDFEITVLDAIYENDE